MLGRHLSSSYLSSIISTTGRKTAFSCHFTQTSYLGLAMSYFSLELFAHFFSESSTPKGRTASGCGKTKQDNTFGFILRARFLFIFLIRCHVRAILYDPLHVVNLLSPTYIIVLWFYACEIWWCCVNLVTNILYIRARLESKQVLQGLGIGRQQTSLLAWYRISGRWPTTSTSARGGWLVLNLQNCP